MIHNNKINIIDKWKTHFDNPYFTAVIAAAGQHLSARAFETPPAYNDRANFGDSSQNSQVNTPYFSSQTPTSSWNRSKSLPGHPAYQNSANGRLQRREIESRPYRSPLVKNDIFSVRIVKCKFEWPQSVPVVCVYLHRSVFRCWNKVLVRVTRVRIRQCVKCVL